MTESGREKVLEEALPIPPDRQDRFEQITQEVVDRWYIDSGRPELASSYKIKWPRYDDAAAFENNARALWDELGLHADDKTCIAILAAALERAAALASPSTQEPALRGGKVEEIALENTLKELFRKHEWDCGYIPGKGLLIDCINAALRTYAGESAAQSERAELKRAARLADEWNWRHSSVTTQPCPDDFHSSLGDAIRALSATRKAGGELEAELQNLADPIMKHMHLENGQLNMAVAGPMVERLALAMTGYFRESGAENYIEFNLNARSEPFERYCVTIQKVEQKSPHQFRQEAELALTAERQRREAAETVCRIMAERPLPITRTMEAANAAKDHFSRYANADDLPEEGKGG